MHDDLLDDLNPAQQQAVRHGEGPLMVLAGAGSGKTRVVTRRIARLLRDGVPAGRILAMTFTNKAAGEMARRVQEMGGGWVRIATFHSACARFLRAEASLLGYPADFSIYDVYDRDSCIKLVMEELGLERTGVKPSAVGHVISRLKNAALRPPDAVYGHDDVARVAQKVYPAYEERMRKLAAMDFDDLLLRFLDLLREQPEVAERYRARFPWLLVDEFQDTNRVQYDLLRQLCPSDGNVCVVGDPDQSIYGFRGAEIRNILDFENDFPGTTVVRLEQNYRSTANILRAAEQVIANNKLRKDKRLRTDNEPGAKLVRFRAAGPAEEADAVGDGIRDLRDGGVPLDQIAVFYRAHWLSRALEQALKDRGLPYDIVGGLTFFERREIKDLLAYLRVLVNPLDDVSMDRIVNVPPRGVGKTSQDRLKASAAAEGASLSEAVLAPELHQGLPKKAQQNLLELGKVLRAAKAAMAQSAHAALKTVIEGIGYMAYATGLGDPEDIAREENIQELVNDVIAFDEKVGEGLAGYLQHVALLTSADRAGEQGPAVQMMTIHAAKGLEFDHVFLCGLEDGLFPSMRALEERDGLEEERRLMYVALTRGRKTVWLGSAKERMVNGAMQRAPASRFLKEIPQDCIEEQEAWHSWESVGSAADGEDPAVGLGVGMRVRHEHFGDGVVRRLNGMGAQARASVLFDDGVERTLILEYAGLQPIEDEAW